MDVVINSTPESLPETVKTVEELLAFKGIPAQGTAVAINNCLVKAADRAERLLEEGDKIVIISAAYGG